MKILFDVIGKTSPFVGGEMVKTGYWANIGTAICLNAFSDLPYRAVAPRMFPILSRFGITKAKKVSFLTLVPKRRRLEKRFKKLSTHVTQEV